METLETRNNRYDKATQPPKGLVTEGPGRVSLRKFSDREGGGGAMGKAPETGNRRISGGRDTDGRQNGGGEDEAQGGKPKTSQVGRIQWGGGTDEFKGRGGTKNPAGRGTYFRTADNRGGE